ncbi:MAG: TraR/DksA family transcriptional regulator [Planctomycetaceae bacterium]
MKRSEFYRKMHDLLLRRRAALRQMLSSDVASLGAHEAGVIDELDASLTSEQLEIDSQLAEVESRELGRIEEALTRFNDGTYGECETCGKSIHVDRLTALPYASQCIKCAQASDKPSYHYGSRSSMEADVA